MAKDYLKLYVKALVRHGKDEEAIQHLVDKGYTEVDAKIYIAHRKIEVDNEHDD